MSANLKANNRLSRTAQRIMRWLVNLPPSFHRIQLGILNPGGADVLLELEASEVADKPHEITAANIQSHAEEWAETHGREARARVAAYADERVVATHNFKVGIPAEDDIDGSIEGQLTQNQRHLEAMMRMSIMERNSLANAWSTALQTLANRVTELEGENKELRKRANNLSGEDQVALAIAEMESEEKSNERLFGLVKLLAGPKGKKAVDAVETAVKAVSDASDGTKGKDATSNGKKDTDT